MLTGLLTFLAYWALFAACVIAIDLVAGWLAHITILALQDKLTRRLTRARRVLNRPKRHYGQR
jgi:hypothetical protein